MTVQTDHYTYRVRWSDEDQANMGTVAEFPSLSWAASDPSDAFAGIRALVAEVLEDMAASGETPLEAIAAPTTPECSW